MTYKTLKYIHQLIKDQLEYEQDNLAEANDYLKELEIKDAPQEEINATKKLIMEHCSYVWECEKVLSEFEEQDFR